MPLTPAQNRVVYEASGRFLVRACPGSGKTYTLAYKTLVDIDDWQDKRSGIAVLSFTNAAAEELLKQVEIIRPGAKVRYPHFIGTIDSFINKYTFFPYADVLGYSPDKIEMIGEPFAKFYSHSVAERHSLSLKYDLSGNLSALSGVRDMSANLLELAKASKASLIKRGRFTQSDANYYALKILQTRPEIAESLARRFPFVYVDEAQDTTAIHWEIIKAITGSSHNKRFGVIGDPDQSIYGWNGAQPELFTDHEAELAKTDGVFLLNDSRRSSQAICDFYFPLSTLQTVPKAINPEVAELGIKPTVVYYSALPEIIDHVNAFIEARSDEDILVLSRSTTFVKEVGASLSGNPAAMGINPWSGELEQPHVLLQARFELERGDYRTAINRAERLVFLLHNRYDLNSFLEELKLSKKEWYVEIETQLSKLPAIRSKSLQEWATEATPVIAQLPFFKKVELKPKNRGKLDYKQTKVSDYFSSYDIDEEERLIQTVHSAKGKTTEHVFLVLNKPNANLLIKALSGRASNTEEKRILYVGMTRARKSITLCAPLEQKPKIDPLLS